MGDAPGRANVGHKAVTLVHSALADGDCIDDADGLRAGETAAVLGHAVLAPSTLGTFLRSFTWDRAHQLDTCPAAFRATPLPFVRSPRPAPGAATGTSARSLLGPELFRAVIKI